MSRTLKSLGWLWKVSLVVAVSVMIPFSMSILEKSDYTAPVYGQWGTGGNTDTTYYISGFNVGASEPGQRIVGSYADFDTLVGAGSGLPGSVRDTVLVVYTDTMSVSVHDTANAVRGEIRDSVTAMGGKVGYIFQTGVLDSVSQISPCDSIQAVVEYGGWVIIAAMGSGVMTFSDTDGVLVMADSVGEPAQGVWCDSAFVFTTHGTNVRSYSLNESTGELTKVDSVTTLPDNGLAVFGSLILDQMWIYVSDDNGQVNVLSSDAGELVLVSTKVAHNSGVGYDVWASDNYVYLANREYGTYAYSNSEGTLTQIDNEDPDNQYAESIWGDVNFIYTKYGGAGVRTYVRESNGTLTYSDVFDPGDYSAAIWGDGTMLFGGLNTFMTGLIVYSIDSNGNIYEDVRKDAISVNTYNGMWGKVEGPLRWIYQGGDDKLRVERWYVPWEYSFSSDTHTLYGNVDVAGDTLWVTDGAAYSYTVAGADWVTSSSQSLKVLDKPFTQALGSQVLVEIAQLPIQTWRFRDGETQNVGPTAEDWYKVAKLVAPKSAKPTEINGSHQTAALLLAIKELNRLNYAQEQELADLRQRITLLELESPLYDK